ncbi:MAG: hypothetical protein NTX96_00170 [Candidatus Zambryskibacteria bacterium]|nr:hypothetical protein [Candidatus Zambryskibacteria bacterium]
MLRQPSASTTPTPTKRKSTRKGGVWVWVSRAIWLVLILGGLIVGKAIWDWTTREPFLTVPHMTKSIEYTTIAPVGSWGGQIPTFHGEIIRPHGPILLRDDKGNVVERDDVAIKKEMAPILKTNWVQVQSRISEPVSVTVSR